MIIEYKEDEILKKEKWNYNKPLIGYINPYGQILDYSMLIGPYGHDNWRNPATPIFLSFVSFVVKNYKVDNFLNFDKEETLYKKNKYEGFDDVVKRGIGYDYYANHDTYDEFLQQLNNSVNEEEEILKTTIEYGGSLRSCNVYKILSYDLVKLFEKLYSNGDFFESLGRVIYAENQEEVLNKYNMNITSNIHERDKFYHNYLIVQLMSYMKDICVQYLGYDSIERAWRIGDLNRVNNIYTASNGYKYSNNPRIIVTSEKNINERFYNWLLMDWTIQQIPKKIWDDKNKKFIDEYYIFNYTYNEKEEILGKEIESIKRLVKKEDRYKYFL